MNKIVILLFLFNTVHIFSDEILRVVDFSSPDFGIEANIYDADTYDEGQLNLIIGKTNRQGYLINPSSLKNVAYIRIVPKRNNIYYSITVEYPPSELPIALTSILLVDNLEKNATVLAAVNNPSSSLAYAELSKASSWISAEYSNTMANKSVNESLRYLVNQMSKPDLITILEKNKITNVNFEKSDNEKILMQLAIKINNDEIEEANWGSFFSDVITKYQIDNNIDTERKGVIDLETLKVISTFNSSELYNTVISLPANDNQTTQDFDIINIVDVVIPNF